MKAGSILFFKDFQFEDGIKKDKLLLILNNPIDAEPYLLCPTTSQQHNRKKILGCHSQNNYYFIDQNQDKFVKDTWVVFHKIYPKDIASVIKSGIDRELIKKFELESSLWDTIKNCILKSIDIEQDFLEMIARN
jgi:hypothetical protein